MFRPNRQVFAGVSVKGSRLAPDEGNALVLIPLTSRYAKMECRRIPPAYHFHSGGILVLICGPN
jgi:hypothetical protein